VQKAQEVFSISERRVCRALGQPRSTQRYRGRKGEDEDFIREQVVALASQYGRYGYRRITALLKMTGWHVNHKRVERTLAPAASAGVWRQAGLTCAPQG
jgi:hypothetical protein